LIGTGEKIGKPATIEEQNAPKIHLQKKQTDQTHLCLGVRAFDMHDPRRYALSVLSDILGGSMSSRLFKKVREEMGAAYYVRSSADLGSDCGMLVISTGIDKERMKEIISAVINEMKRLVDDPVPEDELNKSKEHISGRLILQLETSDELAGYYGSEEAMTGEVRTPEEILENIRKVTAEDIMSVARDIMKNEGLNMAAIGPFDEKTEGDIKGIFKLD
jgi:predicted Zn-dependent peptidase